MFSMVHFSRQARTFGDKLDAVRGKPKKLQQLLEEIAAPSFDVNETTDVGSTPLHYAVCDGFILVIQTLLARGANIGARNDFGCTPIDTARHEDVKTILRAAAAPSDIVLRGEAEAIYTRAVESHQAKLAAAESLEYPVAEAIADSTINAEASSGAAGTVLGDLAHESAE